jgi:hypothetical protein
MINWDHIARLMYRGKARGDLTEEEMKLCWEALNKDPERYKKLKAEQDDFARASLNPLDPYWKKQQ